jgi:hypothetical protein
MKVTGENTQQAQMKRAEVLSIIFIEECETQIEHVKNGNGKRIGRKSRVLTTRGKNISMRKRKKSRGIRRGKVH